MSGISGLALWQSFSFEWAWMLALLFLPWLLRPFLKPVKVRHIPLLAPHISERLKPIQSKIDLTVSQKNTAPMNLWFLLIWLLLIVAAMRPVWYLTPTPFESTGRDMLLSVDLSGSMQKPDMRVQGQAVDRLSALKFVVNDFIAQRQGDRMGLIAFGTEAFMVSPLTYDLNALQQLLNEMEIGMAGNNTAIGDSIGLAIKHLRHSDNRKAVLVLLTDGANNAGALDPIEAAQQAQQQGLVIHTVAFGGEENLIRHNERNISSAMDIDLTALETISALTGGETFFASRTDQLAEIYRRIDEIELSEFTVNQYRARTELFHWPLGAALILSFVMAWRRSRYHSLQGEG